MKSNKVIAMVMAAAVAAASISAASLIFAETNPLPQVQEEEVVDNSPTAENEDNSEDNDADQTTTAKSNGSSSGTWADTDTIESKAGAAVKTVIKVYDPELAQYELNVTEGAAPQKSDQKLYTAMAQKQAYIYDVRLSRKIDPTVAVTLNKGSIVVMTMNEANLMSANKLYVYGLSADGSYTHISDVTYNDVLNPNNIQFAVNAVGFSVIISTTDIAYTSNTPAPTTTPATTPATTTPAVTTPKPTTTTPQVRPSVTSLTVDRAVKTTVEALDKQDLGDYTLVVTESNERFLTESKKYPQLVAAIKDLTAYTYDIKLLNENNREIGLYGDFSVTIATDGLKSTKKVFIYEVSDGYYTLIGVKEPQSNSVSFNTKRLGKTVILSSVDFDEAVTATTTAVTTGTGTTAVGSSGAPLTAPGSAPLKNAEATVYGTTPLGSNIRLKIELLEELDTKNKEVTLAINEKMAIPYNICFVDAVGREVTPSGINRVDVSFDVPEEFKNKSSVYVYRRESDDTFTNMNATLKNGVISFSTNHLSHYVISITRVGDASGNPETTVNTAVTTKKPVEVVVNPGNPNNNPGTGFLVALIPAALAAGGIVIARRKKR